MSGRIYIAVAGNIGAGKSTMVDFLCRTYGVSPFFEPNDSNPYLVDFYKDMKKWAFHSQLYFLTHKFRIHQELDRTPGIVVQDRTIFEDAEVFAAGLHRSRKISARDWQMYHELYQTICNAIAPPDLTIYLKCSVKTIQRRIKLRGRPMEQQIPLSYIKALQNSYESWFARWNKSEVLVIDTDKLDYVSDLVDRLDVLETIERFLPQRTIDPKKIRAARLGAEA